MAAFAKKATRYTTLAEDLIQQYAQASAASRVKSSTLDNLTTADFQPSPENCALVEKLTEDAIQAAAQLSAAQRKICLAAQEAGYRPGVDGRLVFDWVEDEGIVTWTPADDPSPVEEETP